MLNFRNVSFATMIILFASCADTQKSFFTSGTRANLERNNIPMEKVQFYIDRDVELRRELESRDAKVTSGKIKFENGKYLNIIVLKKNTLGVCTRTSANSLTVAFETGEGKALNFAVNGSNIYSVSPNKWIGQTGRVTYDNETYFLQPEGAAARLLVKKSVTEKSEVNKRVMKGVKVEG